MSFLMWLGSFLSGPLLQGALKAYQAKLANANNADQRTADLLARELAVEQREAELQQQLKVSEIGHPFEVEKLFAYVVLVYFSKLLIWDKVFADWTHGATDPLTGFAATTASIVVAFYFGKRAFENVARILKR